MLMTYKMKVASLVITFAADYKSTIVRRNLFSCVDSRQDVVIGDTIAYDMKGWIE